MGSKSKNNRGNTNNGFNINENRNGPTRVSNLVKKGGKTRKIKGGDIPGNTPPVENIAEPAKPTPLSEQTPPAASEDASEKKKQDCKSSCQKTFDTCNQKCDNPGSWLKPWTWRLYGGKSRRSHKKCGGRKHKKTKKSRTLAKK